MQRACDDAMERRAANAWLVLGCHVIELDQSRTSNILVSSSRSAHRRTLRWRVAPVSPTPRSEAITFFTAGRDELELSLLSRSNLSASKQASKVKLQHHVRV